jgi:hypothetical protein
MKLSDIAAKPRLIKITLDEEQIVEQYGESLEFYTWDRQPMEKYLGLVGKEVNTENMPALIEFCKTMILDESGNELIGDGDVLPGYVMSLAINRVVSNLGKF